MNTGVWAKKAIRKPSVTARSSCSLRPKTEFHLHPKGFAIPADLDYVHITSNNTIYGTEYHEDLVRPCP